LLPVWVYSTIVRDINNASGQPTPQNIILNVVPVSGLLVGDIGHADSVEHDARVAGDETDELFADKLDGRRHLSEL
jgi:hypothetical protein